MGISIKIYAFKISPAKTRTNILAQVLSSGGFWVQKTNLDIPFCVTINFLICLNQFEYISRFLFSSVIRFHWTITVRDNPAIKTRTVGVCLLSLIVSVTLQWKLLSGKRQVADFRTSSRIHFQNHND